MACGLCALSWIGLIPEDALIEAAIWYLQLSDFDPNQRIL